MSPTKVVGSSVLTENIYDLLYFCPGGVGCLGILGNGLGNVLLRLLFANDRPAGDGDLYSFRLGVGGAGALVYNLFVNLCMRGTSFTGSTNVLPDAVDKGLVGRLVFAGRRCKSSKA